MSAHGPCPTCGRCPTCGQPRYYPMPYGVTFVPVPQLPQDPPQPYTIMTTAQWQPGPDHEGVAYGQLQPNQPNQPAGCACR